MIARSNLEPCLEQCYNAVNDDRPSPSRFLGRCLIGSISLKDTFVEIWSTAQWQYHLQRYFFGTNVARCIDRASYQPDHTNHFNLPPVQSNWCVGKLQQCLFQCRRLPMETHRDGCYQTRLDWHWSNRVEQQHQNMGDVNRLLLFLGNNSSHGCHWCLKGHSILSIFVARHQAHLVHFPQSVARELKKKYL